MPDVGQQRFDTRDPGAYDYTLVGTAAGTTTIQSYPCFFAGVVLPTWTSAGVITIYDSIGTSTAVIGTITLGTSPTNNPPPTYRFNVRTKTGLTVVNSANQGAVVLFK